MGRHGGGLGDSEIVGVGGRLCGQRSNGDTRREAVLEKVVVVGGAAGVGNFFAV
jgi:hypothetical protein